MKAIATLLIFLFVGTNLLAQSETVVSAKDEKKALKQAEKLLRGTNFSQLAMKYSDDPGSAVCTSVRLGCFDATARRNIRASSYRFWLLPH